MLKRSVLSVTLFWLASLAPAADVPLYDLGTFTRPITTKSPEAQRYFDQGLAFLYGFNHDEAIRAFQRAAELDPDAAMAHWGVALANGPHINNPVLPPERSEAAYAALARARAASANASPIEKALIVALTSRYASPPPEDRRQLDVAYANAMRAVWAAFPNDADVGALFAEAMADLRPWDLWLPDGSPQLPPAEQRGWKDTAMVAPNEILRVIARFDDYTGRWVAALQRRTTFSVRAGSVARSVPCETFGQEMLSSKASTRGRASRRRTSAANSSTSRPETLSTRAQG